MPTVRNISQLGGSGSPTVIGVLIQRPLFHVPSDTARPQLNFQLADPEQPDIKCNINCFGSFAEDYSGSFEPQDTIDIHPSYIKWELNSDGSRIYVLVLDDTYQTTYADGGKVGLFLMNRIQNTANSMEAGNFIAFHELHSHINDKNVSIVGLVVRLMKQQIIQTKKGKGVEKQDAVLSIGKNEGI